jgi:hypothetical protein
VPFWTRRQVKPTKGAYGTLKNAIRDAGMEQDSDAYNRREVTLAEIGS